MVSARPSDTNTATVRVVASAAKNCPTTPCNRPSGRKTTTVVIVEVVTGQMSSWTAFRIARKRSSVSARWRAMFSVITTASSITSPMAIAIAPRVIRLKVWPMRLITNTVTASVRGIAAALIAVMRPWRKNSSSTRTASPAPTSIASRTARTASRTSAAWSYTGLRRTPGGRLGARVAAIRATLSARRSVLPPTCRVMLISAAGRPSPAMTRT